MTNYGFQKICLRYQRNIKTGRFRCQHRRPAPFIAALDKKARMRPRHQPTLRDQPVVGFHHREHTDIVGGCKRAYGGQLPAAWVEHLPGDQSTQTIHDLADQRGGDVGAECEH